MNKIVTILRESRLARFLIPGSIMVIIFGIAFFTISRKNQDYIKTEATVTKADLEQDSYTDADGNVVEATYVITVQYTVDGKSYESELGGLPKYKEGKKMTIYYDPEDPSQITQTKSLIIPLIIIAAGVAMLAGGIISAANAVKRYKRMKEQEEEWSNVN